MKILGPLGNGFTQKDKKAILIGGGIGIPPMLELMKQLDCEKTAVLGYRDSDMFLKDEFEGRNIDWFIENYGGEDWDELLT